MTKYESQVRYSAYPVESVYAKLSDLSNLEALKTAATNPTLRETIATQSGGKVSAEQVDKIATQLQQLVLTPDTVTTSSPVGNITLRVVERQEPKLVKLALEGAPLTANLWIQLLPNGNVGTAFKVTIGADMNFLIKQMLKGKLQDAAEGIAQMLAALAY